MSNMQSVTAAASARPVMQHPIQIVINVTHEDGMWLAQSDRIGLVTEAKTYEEVIQRAMDIAPELIEANQVLS